MFAIPRGWDRITQKAVNTAEIDLLYILKEPYTDDEVESFILKTLENCYTKEYKGGLGSLEKHFGVNTWFKAVTGLKYVSLSYAKLTGFAIMPTIKVPRKGYAPQIDKWINLGLTPEKDELAQALFKAFDESTI